MTNRGSIDGDGLRKHPVLGVDTVGDARVVRLGGELLLQLVERRESVALDLVAEYVDESGEPIDGAQVRPEAAREEHRGNREVLGPRAAGYDGSFHPHKPHWPGLAGQPATFA